MKHDQIVNRIIGAHLKEEHLEAFLTQSAYIDGLLDLLALKTGHDAFATEQEPDEARRAILIHLRNMSLYGKIQFFRESQVLSADICTKLDEYRKIRNRVLHRLMDEIASEKFEHLLKTAYDIGDSLINTKEFKEADEILRAFETIRAKIAADVESDDPRDTPTPPGRSPAAVQLPTRSSVVGEASNQAAASSTASATAERGGRA